VIRVPAAIQSPVAGDCEKMSNGFYIGSQEVFARPGAKVTIDLQLSDALPVKTDGDVEIAWEVWDGHNWKKLETTTILTGQPITALPYLLC